MQKFPDTPHPGQHQACRPPLPGILLWDNVKKQIRGESSGAVTWSGMKLSNAWSSSEGVTITAEQQQVRGDA